MRETARIWEVVIKVIFVVICGNIFNFTFDKEFWGSDQVKNGKTEHSKHGEYNDCKDGIFGDMMRFPANCFQMSRARFHHQGMRHMDVLRF